MVAVHLHIFCCWFFHFYESKCLHPCLLQNGKICWVDNVVFSHMSKPHFFCHHAWVGDPSSWNLRRRWDPGEGNILVSSVLSAAKAQGCLIQASTSPMNSLGWGCYMNHHQAIMWTDFLRGWLWCGCLSLLRRYSFSQGLWERTLRGASYWRKTQREKNCALHRRVTFWFRSPSLCSDKARTAFILNGDHVAYFLRDPVHGNQNNHRWIHKSRRTLNCT